MLAKGAVQRSRGHLTWDESTRSYTPNTVFLLPLCKPTSGVLGITDRLSICKTVEVLFEQEKTRHRACANDSKILVLLFVYKNPSM